GEYLRAVLRDELTLDLRLRRAGVHAPLDDALHLGCRLRVRLGERLALADGTHDLVLELGERRLRAGRRRRPSQDERHCEGHDEPHERSASSIPWRRSAAEIWPMTCPTTRPRGSTKNVSGNPVSPHDGHIESLLSCTAG